jgi:L-iditol 2-dehydrogenase
VGENVDKELIGKRVAVEPAIYCYECEFCRSGKYNICPNVKFLGTPPVFGAYSEYITMPVKNIIPIPDEVSYEGGVMLEPLTICYHGIERIGREKIKKAKAITIIGCGPIGLSMIALIRNITDAMIFALDRIDYRLEKAKALGANYTYNIEETPFLDNILSKTKYGSDITIEAAGEESSMYNASEVTAPGGTVLIAGIPDTDNIIINAHSTRKKELDIKLLRRSNFNELEASEYLKNNKEIVNSMITHNFALKDIKKGFDLVANYSDGAIKVIINP